MADDRRFEIGTGRGWAADLSAGLVVFLVALPLCLGVALASNAPLFSGILAGIVGGILVGVLSGSHTSVSGPAAGLTAVVAAQIATLGSFEAFLAAVVLAGAIQIGLGLVRAGSIVNFVPTSVIQGLLAAIGLILILKQIPHLIGHDTDPEGEMAFLQPDQETTFTELARTLEDIHPGAAVVGLGSLLFLLLWDRIKVLKKSPVPSALLVVLLGVGSVFLLEEVGGRWFIGTSHLVQVPAAASLEGFLGFLSRPDFAALATPTLYVAAVTIALVASLETLLNLEAVDKLDPRKRVSPPNRELIAQGVGNLAGGFIGALPVTSVIIRSSVNINSGARSKVSAIFHGVLLLVCVGLLPGWLNRIPLSCLAAILIVTGFKLASFKLFKRMWRDGMERFLPFVLTILAILFTDLLIGILIGLGFAILFVLYGNLKRPLHRVREKHLGGEVLRIELANQVSFLNRVALRQALDEVPRGGHVLLDARWTDYIDADVLALLREYEEETAPARGVTVSLLGFKERYRRIEDKVQYLDHATPELQASLQPREILQILQDGNERYQRGEPLVRDLRHLRSVTAVRRHPLALVVGGTSSRTPIEMLFDVGLGDIYCTRTTGHALSSAVLGSIEFACVHAGVRLVVVLGHTRNTAVKQAIEAGLRAGSEERNGEPSHMESILDEIAEAIDPATLERWPAMTTEERWEAVDRASVRHVDHTIERMQRLSPAVEKLVEQGRVHIVGAMYDVATGRVDFRTGDLDRHQHPAYAGAEREDGEA